MTKKLILTVANQDCGTMEFRSFSATKGFEGTFKLFKELWLDNRNALTEEEQDIMREISHRIKNSVPQPKEHIEMADFTAVLDAAYNDGQPRNLGSVPPEEFVPAWNLFYDLYDKFGSLWAVIYHAKKIGLVDTKSDFYEEYIYDMARGEEGLMPSVPDFEPFSLSNADDGNDEYIYFSLDKDGTCGFQIGLSDGNRLFADSVIIA